jgi:hypothetical protein
VLLVRGCFYVLFAWSVYCAFKYIRSRMPILAAVFVAGFVVRAILGVALFLISYFRAPFLVNMQLGGGFWTLALDARGYFHAAASATILGISTIPAGSPSPTYVRTLALWLELAGVSPVSAMLLNLGCYTVSAVLIVGSSASVMAAAVPLIAVTCSPALIIFGTQALKDPMCVFLIVLAIAGTRMWDRALTGAARSVRNAGVAGATCLCIAVVAFAGIRTYFALFLILTTIAMGVTSLLSSSDSINRFKAFASYSALMPLLWVTFMIGAGAYYPYYGAFVNAALGNPLRPIAALDTARLGFVTTGGATSIVPESESSDISPLAVSGGDVVRHGVASRLKQTARGCAVLFVPITFLRGLSIVSFTGGRGLLLITDLDTLVMDLGIVASLLFIFSRGLPRSSMPVTIFALALALLTTVSMAYVVTNFGTLFRLRLLAVTPMWVLPAFVTLRDGGLTSERGVRTDAGIETTSTREWLLATRENKSR